MLNDQWAALGDWSPLKALQRVQETHWMIDGVIPAGSINWMVAAPESFKTFIALDMCTSIASGRPWRGRPTSEAVVLYVAGEGDDDIHVRRAAAEMAAGVSGPLCIVQMRPRLDEPHGLASLMALVQRVSGDKLTFSEVDAAVQGLPEKYLTPDEMEHFNELVEREGPGGQDPWDYAERTARSRLDAWDAAVDKSYWYFEGSAPDALRRRLSKNIMLVIDTYSQTSADDAKGVVSRYIKTLRDLQEKAAALGGTITVLVVDHTTKSGESYMGSLAKLGDSDSMMEVNRHGTSNSVTLNSLKMRSGPRFGPIHLELQPFTLSGFTDAQDRPLTSLCVVDGEHGHRIRKAAGANGDTSTALLLAVLADSGPCKKEALRANFSAHPSNAQKNADSVKRAFNRAFVSAQEIGAILSGVEGLLHPQIPGVSGSKDSDRDMGHLPLTK